MQVWRTEEGSSEAALFEGQNWRVREEGKTACGYGGNTAVWRIEDSG